MEVNIKRIIVEVMICKILAAGWRPIVNMYTGEWARRPLVKSSISGIFITTTGSTSAHGTKCDIPRLYRSFNEGITFEEIIIPIPHTMMGYLI